MRNSIKRRRKRSEPKDEINGTKTELQFAKPAGESPSRDKSAEVDACADVTGAQPVPLGT